MLIDKTYFTLPEIFDRWDVTAADVTYLAVGDRLRLSVPVSQVLIFVGEFTDREECGYSKVPSTLERFSGPLDLLAKDVHEVFRSGSAWLRDFRTDYADYACFSAGEYSIEVKVSDLVLRREERDRFEAENGALLNLPSKKAPNFFASPDYRDVTCSGHRFKLGVKQAGVVRALHSAALKGDPRLPGKVLLAEVGSASMRLGDLFKSQSGWRNLILSDGSGGYQLNV